MFISKCTKTVKTVLVNSFRAFADLQAEIWPIFCQGGYFDLRRKMYRKKREEKNMKRRYDI